MMSSSYIYRWQKAEAQDNGIQKQCPQGLRHSSPAQDIDRLTGLARLIFGDQGPGGVSGATAAIEQSPDYATV